MSVDSVEPGLTNYDGSSVVGVPLTYVNNGTEQASYNSYDWKGEDANGAQEYTTYYSDATDDLGSGTLAAGGTSPVPSTLRAPRSRRSTLATS